MPIVETDVEFARAGDESLLLRVYRNDAKANGHAIVSVHGGAWSKNDRTSAHVLDRGLAASGLTVFALDFRQGPRFKYPAASQDIAAGIRWVRAHATDYAIAPDTIGLIGGSSGGQLALLAAFSPREPRFGTTLLVPLGAGEPSDRSEVSARVAYVMALWPVSDPIRRYHYAQEVGRDDLVEGHRMYFSNEADMQEASIQRLLRARADATPAAAHENDALPPVWLVQPGADTNVPQAMTLDLLAALQEQDVETEYVFYPGQPHALTRDPGPMADRCIRDAVAFIARQLDRL